MSYQASPRRLRCGTSWPHHSPPSARSWAPTSSTWRPLPLRILQRKGIHVSVLETLRAISTQIQWPRIRGLHGRVTCLMPSVLTVNILRKMPPLPRTSSNPSRSDSLIVTMMPFVSKFWNGPICEWSKYETYLITVETRNGNICVVIAVRSLHRQTTWPSWRSQRPRTVGIKRQVDLTDGSWNFKAYCLRGEQTWQRCRRSLRAWLRRWECCWRLGIAEQFAEWRNCGVGLPFVGPGRLLIISMTIAKISQLFL